MSARRLLPLLLLALFGTPLMAEGEKKQEGKKEEPAKKIVKPTQAEINDAREALQAKDWRNFLDRYDAADVALRSADPAFVPILLDSAIGCLDPAFAVYAGEVANKLDAKAAIRAYDARKKKLRKLPEAQAIRFLGEIISRDALTRLGERSKGGWVEARVEALYGLVKQKDEAAHKYLVAALGMRDYEVKVPAAICCGLARAKSASPLLLKGLGDAKKGYAYFAAWALGQMRDPELLKKAISAGRGRLSGDVGQAKAKAILECAFDPQVHIEPLIKLVKSNTPMLAGAAAWALGNIGKGDAAAAAALFGLVTRGRDTVLQSLAVDALGRIGSAADGKSLLARYVANPGKIPKHHAKLFGLLKIAEAAPMLLQVAYKNKNMAIRKQAAIAFWQCADDAARAAFHKKLMASTAGKTVYAGCLVLGFDRSAEGFQFAVKLLRRHYGKKVNLFVRDALERMTGRRFAMAPGIWKNWWKENSDFFERKPQLLDREKWRKELVHNKIGMGISKKTETAVEYGLAWLSRHQSLDGRWVGDRFYVRCTLYHRKKCQIGARLGGWDIGMSGISLLAFYGAGYNPKSGRYKDAVLRGQVFQAAQQWANGDFGGQTDLIGGYTRPIASIALSEAYGTTADQEFYERAWRSASHIIRIQYDDAGWRYRLGGQFPGDTSVTGWNAWAIATARKFGIPVDPNGLEGANTLINSFSSPVTQDEEFYNHDPRYFFDVGRGQEFEHFTGYNAREETRPPMTAIGLICKIFMGNKRSHPYCIGAANRLLKSIPVYDEAANKIKYTTGAEYPVYYWYYGSLAMYQMGGRFWRRWSRPLLTEGVPNVQVKGDVCEFGSWDCNNLDSIGGRVYTTAMGVLTLETFYRYLPALSLQK